jgi:hypothetical protein
MITYLWCQIQLIIPSRRFRSIECRHFYLFWKYVTWSLFPRITWYSLFHTSDLSVLKHSFLFCHNFCAHVGHIQDEGLCTRYRSVAGVTELSNKFCTSKFPITWHTFKTSKNGDIQWIWSGGWEWWAVSGIIGRWSWFYLHIYAAKYVYFWILQRRLARHWGAGIIHVSSRRGYMKKNFTNRTMHGWYRIQRQAISENNSGFESQKGLSNHPPTL